MSKTTEEILNSICGVTEEKTEFHGLPRAITSVLLCEIKPDGTVKTIQEATSVHGEVSINFREDYVQVNIRFESDKTDCNKITQIFQKKDDFMNKRAVSEGDVSDQSIYAVSLTFVPADMADNIGQIQCFNPIFYALTAKNVNEPTSRLDTLTMLFASSDFIISEYENVDTTRLQVQINSELESQDFTNRRAEEKRERYAAEQQRIGELIKKNRIN